MVVAVAGAESSPQQCPSHRPQYLARDPTHPRGGKKKKIMYANSNEKNINNNGISKHNCILVAKDPKRLFGILRKDNRRQRETTGETMGETETTGDNGRQLTTALTGTTGDNMGKTGDNMAYRC